MYKKTNPCLVAREQHQDVEGKGDREEGRTKKRREKVGGGRGGYIVGKIGMQRASELIDWRGVCFRPPRDKGLGDHICNK